MSPSLIDEGPEKCMSCGARYDLESDRDAALARVKELENLNHAGPESEWFPTGLMAKRQARIARLEEALLACNAALGWCGGSNDFSEGGIAREGWVKVVWPAQAKARAALAEVRERGML